MVKYFCVVCVFSVLLLVPPVSLAGNICLDSDGEALIVNGDLPSAKAEAIIRAKWGAVERAVGMEVKSQSIVQNMVMVDESISKQVNGSISRFKVLDVKEGTGVVNVKINACVEPSGARDALAGMALNNSVAVFITATKPKVTGEYDVVSSSPNWTYERHDVRTTDHHEETNILSETVIGKLAEHGYTVIDAAPTDVVDALEVEQMMKSGNYLALRSLMYRFLTNIILIGKVDYSVSTRKGENLGNGITMPFNHVTVRLMYRLVTRDASGKMAILAAGTEIGKGLASNLEDAATEGLKDLSENLVPTMLDRIGKHIKGGAKKIEVRISGGAELGDNFALKDILQNIAWVGEVEDKGLGRFLVSYPENPVYLANSICQKKEFALVSYSPHEINLKYTHPKE